MECERGEVTTTVLAMPIAMLLILVVVQAALVFHAQALVDAAAQDGVEAGQGKPADEAAIHSTVQSIFDGSAGNLLSNVDVYVQAESARLSVTVQATVKSLIPGYSPTVSSTAAGPREVFVPLPGR